MSTPRKAFRLALAALGAGCLAIPALSNPLNPVVVNGTASFNQAGPVLTVTNSNGAIIQWDKFSIKAGETTHFAQTSASSSVMNRVLNDPTAIYGTLSSNGNVWLVNPAGIMVGPGGRIDTAGFVASTLNISNENFLAGKKLFENTPGAGSVINQGEIRTPAGGSVYLIGSNVANESIISTPQGETILAAGATVSLVDSATPGVKVDITGAEGNATNLGQITAEAGRIGIAGVIVRNSGTLNASSVVSEGGRVFLKASRDARIAGSVVAAGTPHGSIEITADRIDIEEGARIDMGTPTETLVTIPVPGRPIEAVVGAGSATLNQPGGSLSLGNGNGAIADWDRFSVQGVGSLSFGQSAGSSVTLARVFSERWAIYGTHGSNGKLWLVNPAGIMIGPGKRIDTAGFVAATQAMNNANYHATRLQAVTDLTFAKVVSQRSSATPVGGGVFLVGRERTAAQSGGPSVAGATIGLIDSATPGIKVELAGAGGGMSAGEITAAAQKVGIAGVLVRGFAKPGASLVR